MHVIFDRSFVTVRNVVVSNTCYRLIIGWLPSCHPQSTAFAVDSLSLTDGVARYAQLTALTLLLLNR